MGFNCYDAYKEQDIIWFSAIDHNGLYKMHVDDNEIIKLAVFMCEENTCEIHRRIITYNRVLFFIPFKGNVISSYDLDTEVMEYYLPAGVKEIHASDAFLDGNKIWILPRQLDQPLYEFNIEQKIFYKHEEWNNKLLNIFDVTENNILSLTSTCLVNKTLMTVVYNTAYIIKTDLTTGEIELYHLSDNLRLRGIIYDNGHYLLTLAIGGAILCVDFASKTIDYIKLDTSKKAIFMNLIVDDQYIIVLPCKNSNIYKVYKNQNLTCILEDDKCQFNDKSNLPMYLGWIKDGDELLILPSAGNDIVRHDVLNEKEVEFFSERVRPQSSVIYERNETSLNSFIGNINAINSVVNPNIDCVSNGKIIWKTIVNSRIG
ncbi:MAG: hypothetical protein EWM47_05960 [Anaerolineaceae bacterium]|nr:MAG: hypothetical protein EWM47_05960 [Anaerolineaceae bacterium]